VAFLIGVFKMSSFNLLDYLTLTKYNKTLDNIIAVNIIYYNIGDNLSEKEYDEEHKYEDFKKMFDPYDARRRKSFVMLPNNKDINKLVTILSSDSCYVLKGSVILDDNSWLKFVPAENNIDCYGSRWDYFKIPDYKNWVEGNHNWLKKNIDDRRYDFNHYGN
jgi:hypothetical protein